jgi:hypothetical protein
MDFVAISNNENPISNAMRDESLAVCAPSAFSSPFEKRSREKPSITIEVTTTAQ